MTDLAGIGAVVAFFIVVIGGMMLADWIGIPAIFILLLVFIASVAAFLVHSFRQERKRAVALKVQAMLLGMTFRERDSPDEYPFCSLPLFGPAQSRRCLNIMEREMNGLSVFLLDYVRVTGVNRNTSTTSQTVAAFGLKDAALPGFRIRPENLFLQLAKAVGFKEIDFHEDRAFSDAFNVKGTDEAGIRRHLTADRRAALLRNPSWHVEGEGDWVILYPWSRLVSPEELPAFFESARALAEVLIRDRKAW